jgi:hypothetical protein
MCPRDPLRENGGGMRDALSIACESRGRLQSMIGYGKARVGRGKRDSNPTNTGHDVRVNRGSLLENESTALMHLTLRLRA